MQFLEEKHFGQLIGLISILSGCAILSGCVMKNPVSDKDDDAGDTGSADTDTDTDSDTNTVECSEKKPCEGDGLACTDEVCQDGECVSVVKSSYCLIDGKCYNHNQNDPDNECRYCDATLNNKAWINWSKSITCDDELWCNGADNCDGSGDCSIHEYPTGNRCTALQGECVRTTCDEQNDSCYLPDTTPCGTTTQNKRCSADDTCGAAVEHENLTTYCSGTSPACNGRTELSWSTFKQCEEGEICDGATTSCKAGTKCGCDSSIGWYDAETDLCWQNPPNTEDMLWDEAVAYCESGTWGGNNDWRLPNIDELISIIRGCQNGEEGGSTKSSLCFMAPVECVQDDDCSETVACTSCDSGSGPDSDPDGCYWVQNLSGSCNNGYWSSNTDTHSPLIAWVVSYYVGSAYGAGKVGLPYSVRCVRGEPWFLN